MKRNVAALKQISIPILSAILIISIVACNRPPIGSQEESQRVAEEFVKLEATFRFDGILETLKVTSTTSVANGWKYTLEFDSRHVGYGNRTGQILAQVITHHVAEVTVQSGRVTKAVMDNVWDMMKGRMLDNMEIDLAPIHEVKTSLLKSNPPQVDVYIKGGLRDGCTTFHNIEVSREGNIINIRVTTKHPKDTSCPAIYGFFEKNLNLGSDFAIGTSYTLNVNDHTSTLTY